MKTNLFVTMFKTFSPFVLGALGGVVAVSYPAAHTAFCSAGVF